MSLNKIELTYFPVRGRVEPARLLLELAHVPYEFHGVGVETWMKPETKPFYRERTPFGQLPILEIDGERMCQSAAIARYLAEELGVGGRDARERARIDEVTETGLELVIEQARFFWDPNFAGLRAQNRETIKDKLASLAAYFTRTRATPLRWIDAARYTLGDVLIAYALEMMLPLHPGLVEEFPELHRFTTEFFRAPGVAEYVRSARRPRTFTVHMAQFGGRPEDTHQWA